MSKFDIRPQFECQNRILNIKMRYSVEIRMSKLDFECQNSIFGPNSNIKIGFRMSKFDIRPKFECQNRISKLMSKFDTRPQIGCQNRILPGQNAILGPNSNVEKRKAKNENQTNFTINRISKNKPALRSSILLYCINGQALA